MAEYAHHEHELIDLIHLGRPGAIGAWRVGDVIIDPGPSSCLERLLPVLERHPPRVIALTHIHLDHAGSAGTLAARFPEAEIWVHERGARHLADPSRLLDSASRLYGSDMDRLWGEVRPVGAERMRVLSGGETLEGFDVAYTPGHAKHHVSYLHRSSGYAFTGDVAGVRIGGGAVLAPTPPPDIDLEAWDSSLELLEGWAPRALAITHFGVYMDAQEQLASLRSHLPELRSLAAELGEEEFALAIRARVAASAEPALLATYDQATSSRQNYQGLRRYLGEG
jgi:glyoxylase-like metal-dependent hydrolase (beta-lactamase superfamily II)